MTDDFESVIMFCGHSVSPYSGLGVCHSCGRKSCGKCLQLVVDELLCPRCFVERVRKVGG